MHKFFVRLSWGLIFTGMVLLLASMGVYLLGKNHIRNTEPIEATVIDVVPYGETAVSYTHLLQQRGNILQFSD